MSALCQKRTTALKGGSDPKGHFRRLSNRREGRPVAVTGPEVLDSDMTARDICDTLKRLRFRNGPQLIALGDKEVRDFLVDAVRARIGDHRSR